MVSNQHVLQGPAWEQQAGCSSCCRTRRLGDMPWAARHNNLGIGLRARLSMLRSVGFRCLREDPCACLRGQGAPFRDANSLEVAPKEQRFAQDAPVERHCQAVMLYTALSV